MVKWKQAPPLPISEERICPGYRSDMFGANGWNPNMLLDMAAI